ncbi:hypothetical protein MHSWG343_05280 [Candidatus Mycoplasma haematohominis]|uniref:Uncharacterized protein n=1 Tax=Candidatus Mycoplasma haematohominis TaxID=1494318 RepID=A0A478FQ10_9MOLU|nr:hypothetical protein MHSWG343_05280 [Candidatus Mycoplasma haemohominis]
MSIFSTIVKALTATGVVSGAAGVGSKIYLKNGHGFGTMDVDPVSNVSTSNTQDTATVTPTQNQEASTRTTYGSLLIDKKYELVKADTSNDIILNIMMERLDPTKDSLSYSQGQRFSVSSPVTFGTKKFDSQIGGKNYSLTVLQKPQDTFIDPWKQACIQALAVEVTKEKVEKSGTTEYSEMAKLREWCTIPTVDQVLRRHKLTPLNTNTEDTKDDEEWKTVISGGWFKKEGDKNNWEDQSFIKDEADLNIVVGTDKSGINGKNDVDKSKIDVFKKRCKDELSKPFERKNFYLTTQFINGITGDKPEIDAFQETALFCVKSFTASQYITDSLQGLVSDSVEISADDYCYLSDVSNKESLTTNNPLGGKSFWCAVKSLYKAKPRN